MKAITIVTKYGPVSLIDNDERDSDEIMNDLAELMKSSTITKITTSESSAIIRPSLVSGILIQDYPTKDDSPQPQSEIEQQELEQNSEEVSEVEIDIIKDMD